MSVATISLYDVVTDSQDVAVPNATVTLTFGYNAATTADGLLAPSVRQVQTDSTGKFTFAKVIPNDLISPANTVYQIDTPFRTYQVAPQSGNGSSQQSTAANVIVNNPLGLAPYTGLSSLTVSGPLTVTGLLTAASAAITGAFSAGISTISGLLTAAAGLVVSGGTGATINASGDIAGRSFTASSGSGPYVASSPAGTINDLYLAPPPLGSSQDDWSNLQTLITTVQNAGGGTILLQGLAYTTTKTLNITASNVRLEMMDGGSIKFNPTGPFLSGINDRAVWIQSGFSARRQMAAGAIAVGAATFTANTASDTNDLVAGDWIMVTEYDVGNADLAVIDWVQVLSVNTGTGVVTIQGAFRTAFPNARAWVATVPFGGLAFQRVTGLVENTQLVNLNIIQPTQSQSNPGIGVGVCRRTLLDNCTVNNYFGQAFYAYRSADLTVRDCHSLFAGAAASELAGCVDLRIEGGNFGFVGTPGNQVQPNTAALTLDSATAWFSVHGTTFLSAGNLGIQLLGVADGEIVGTNVGWVRNAGSNGVGILAHGARRISVAYNDLAGGEGASVGISSAATSGYTVNINPADNVWAFNKINNFTTRYAITVGADLVIEDRAGTFGVGVDSSGNSAAAGVAWMQVSGDGAVNDLLRLVSTNVGNPRTISIGSNIGGGTRFQIRDVTGSFAILDYLTTNQMVTFPGGITGIGDLILGSAGGPAGRFVSLQDNPPTIGSTGSGVSAASIIAGSTNMAGQAQATLTAVAPGVVIGVVAFDDGPLATAPKVVVCSLSAPTAGDASPCNVGADTFTTSGFTLRSYGPTTVTTATYIINYICIF